MHGALESALNGLLSEFAHMPHIAMLLDSHTTAGEVLRVVERAAH